MPRNSYFIVAALCAATLFLAPLAAARRELDSIVARVNGALITASDLRKPQVTKEMVPFTLDEAIREELWVQRAKERNAVVQDTEIDKMILARRKDLGIELLSDEEANEAFMRDVGMSYDDYCEQLRRNYLASRARMELYSRAVVTDHEIRAYCAAHPVIEPARYHFRFISETHPRPVGAPIAESEWIDMGWVLRDDVARHLRVVYTLSVGERSAPITHNGTTITVELLGAQDERAQSIEERYAFVSSLLQNEKLAHASAEMERELLAKAVVIKL